MTYRIKDWNRYFEHHRTRDLVKMTWVPMPNKMDGDGYTELLSHANGAAHLGAWLALVEIASKSETRGTLTRGNAKPHTLQTLERISLIPARVFAEAIPRLVEIGWLEKLTDSNDTAEDVSSDTDAGNLAVKRGESRALAPEGAVNPARQRRACTVLSCSVNTGKEVQEKNQWFDQLREIYWASGKTWSPKAEPALRKKFQKLSLEKQKALCEYVTGKIADGSWSEPRYTKSLANVLREADFDAPVVPRSIPRMNSKSKTEIANDQAALKFMQEDSKDEADEEANS